MKVERVKRLLATAVATALALTTVAPQGVVFAASIENEELANSGAVAEGDVVTKTTREWDGEALGEEQQTNWKVVWNDEFEGTTVDSTKWGYQVGDGREYGLVGWGNNEKEYYTNGDNVEVSDGKLTITAKKDSSYGNGSTYTSGKLWTKTNDGQTLFAKKYGRIEAKMSLPAGTGYWPAFWMMPLNDVYGGWAASGEIDIMEARGRVPDSIDGTAHYGSTSPNKKAKGSQYDTRIDENFTFTEEHEYALEWLPGELKWYVDDVCYYTLTDWYSIGTDNVENFTYPAPFDQEFYIMLNLAVGGNYDGNQLDESINGGQMVVDYVRVYDLLDENGNVYNYEKDENSVETAASSATGGLEGGIVGETNFIGSDLTQAKPVTEEKHGNEGWYLQCQSDASANVQAAEGGAKVNIASAGANSYSVQLMHQFPLTQGYEYELTFEAKSDANRNITAQMSDFVYLFLGSWDKYSNVFDVSLTPEWKTYTYRFAMTEPTDDYVRLEMNMGASSTDSVYIRNASLKALGVYEGLSETDEKEPTKGGEHIYNGTFDQGNNKDANDQYTRLRFWSTFGGANASVSNKERKLVLASGTDANAGIEQVNVQLLAKDTYKLKYDTDTTGVEVKVVGNDGTVYVAKEAEAVGTQEVEFTVPADAAVSYGSLQFIIGNTGKTATIDNVSMTRETNYNVDYSGIKVYPLENGTFENGLAPWTTYPAEVAGLVRVDNNICTIEAIQSGNPWDRMLISNGLNIQEGLKYQIHFETKAARADEKFTAKIENSSYTTIFNEELKTTTEWTEHDFTFTASTGGNMELKFLLAQVSAACDISFRNIQLSVLNAPISQAPYVTTDGIKKANEDAIYNLTYAEGTQEAFEAASKVVTINGTETDVTFDTQNNTFTIPASVFSTEGSYKVKIVAEGFDFIEFTAQVYPSGKNVVLNGSFSNDLEGWGSYFNTGEGTPAGSISTTKSGEAKIDYVWSNDFWDAQMSQTGIPMETGSMYEIKFDARATLDRPIMLSVNGQSTYYKVGSDYKTYTYYYTASAAEGKLELFFGDVSMGSLSTPTDAHSIYFDNIQVNKMDSTDIANMIPTVEVKQSYKLTQDVELTLTNVKDAWANASKTVYLNGEAIADDFVNFNGNTLTIYGNAFNQTGVYEVVIGAEGFADTNLVLQQITSVGLQEYIENGDFSQGGEGWSFWAGGEPACAEVTYANNEASVNMIYPWMNQFGVYDTWGIQLSKANVLVEAGQEYILKFQAKSEISNRVVVDISGKQYTFNMTEEYQEFECRYTPTSSTISVAFFLGDCNETTPNNIKMAVKEVSLQKAMDEVLDGVVAYKVEHYLQQGNTYVLKETTEGAAEVNSTVTAEPKNYTGYTFASTLNGNVTSGNVGEENGALTLKLYYKANTYQITYELNQEGATNTGNANKYTYGEGLILEEPQCEGFVFTGWYLDEACTMQIDSVAANMTGDITLYATWTVDESGDDSGDEGTGGSGNEGTGGSGNEGTGGSGNEGTGGSGNEGTGGSGNEGTGGSGNEGTGGSGNEGTGGSGNEGTGGSGNEGTGGSGNEGTGGSGNEGTGGSGNEGTGGSGNEGTGGSGNEGTGGSGNEGTGGSTNNGTTGGTQGGSTGGSTGGTTGGTQTPVHTHTWMTDYTIIKDATTTETGLKGQKCSGCNEYNTSTQVVMPVYTVKLNATSAPLQIKKSTAAVKATVVEGDKVVKWSTSNSKIATVNNSGKIKAKKKTGTVKITATTAKGATATISIKVQKGKVTTKKVAVTNVSKKKLALQKGAKFTLETALTPITSPEKIKYTTSNKKVATVSKKGQITAKKAGKAKITVKSGTKKVVINVTVK